MQSFAVGNASHAARRLVSKLRRKRRVLGRRLQQPHGACEIAIIQRGNKLADGEEGPAIIGGAATHGKPLVNLHDC
jgi:hypothetical protein